MAIESVTSSSNAAVKRLRALSDSKGRKSAGAFLVEGEVMIREALQSGLTPLEALSEQESPLCQLLSERGAAVRLCPRHVMESVCDTKTPQGVCCAFVLPENGSIPQSARRLLALDGVQDPGNMGTILRTADAAGFEGAYLSPLCADVYSPKVQRAAMGSGFRVPSVRQELPQALLRLKEAGYTVIGSALDGLPIYEHAELSRLPRIVLVIGNEARGISENVRRVCDLMLKLPMRGRAESLNAAVAAGILMYELTRPE